MTYAEKLLPYEGKKGRLSHVSHHDTYSFVIDSVYTDDHVLEEVGEDYVVMRENASRRIIPLNLFVLTDRSKP
jgi:hypothetical protein